VSFMVDYIHTMGDVNDKRTGNRPEPEQQRLGMSGKQKPEGIQKDPKANRACHRISPDCVIMVVSLNGTQTDASVPKR